MCFRLYLIYIYKKIKTPKPMKQKLIVFTKVILLYFIIVFSSCENENITAENSNPSISNAKSWFGEFKAKENFQPIFKDLTCNWQNAKITALTNGQHAIAVPVLLPNQSQEYYGHKIMYLYPKNRGTAYDVSLFEFIPNPNKLQIRQDTVDLIAFDGYIINWDLVNGFVRGSKFEKNIAVNDINLKVIYSKKNNTHKEGEIIALEEVVVYGKPNSNSGGSYTLVITGTYSPFGTGTNSGIYINTPYGGGGRGDGNVNTQINPCDKIKELLNNAAFKAKLDVLKAQTGLTKENGFAQDKNGVFTTLTANGSDAVTMSKDVNRIGYIHTHINPYDKVNADGDLDSVNPIKMFSPEDVKQFLIIVNNAQNNNIPISDVYGTMVSSSGTYQLKFSGNVADINSKNSSINWGTLDNIYIKYTKNDSVSGFLNFLKDMIGIDGIELYKIDASGNSLKTLDSTGKVISINCN